MLRTRWTSTLFAAAIASLCLALSGADSALAGNHHFAGGHFAGHRGEVTCREYEYGRADLFYNFYVPPTCGGVGAELYPAPLPVPAEVGQVYYTYQPLMPHEMLYKHHRSYHRYYDQGRGLTRTSVTWW